MFKTFNLSHFIKGNPGRVYRILTLVLVGGTVLWTAWNLIYKLGAPFPGKKSLPPARQSSPVKVTMEPAAPAQPLSAYSSIAEKNPFGMISAPPGGQNAEGPPQPPPLELVGTIAFGNTTGFAVLKEAGQDNKKVYKIGDAISGGRTLVQVSRNMVVFKKGEAMETIHARTVPLQSLTLQQGDSEVQEKLVARNEMMKNLNNVIDENLIRPHFTDGKMDGFVIGNVPPDSPLKARGFESGDLLQGINNKPIKEPDDVFLLQSLKNDSGKVTYNIKRQGRSMVLSTP